MATNVLTKELYDRIFTPEIQDMWTRRRSIFDVENQHSRDLDANTATNVLTIEYDGKNRMFNLSEAVLEIKLKGAGSNTLANLAKLGYSLFPFIKKASFHCMGTRFEDNQEVQIASTVRALTENTRMYNETVLSASGFSATKTGNRQLHKFENQTIKIPLLSIFACLKDMPLFYGCSVRFEFLANNFNDKIYTDDLAASGTASACTDVYINDIRLKVPVYVPTDVQRAEIESRLLNAGFEREILFEHVYTRRSPLMVAGSNPTENFTVAGGTPVRVYMIPIPKAYDGVKNEDRTIFLPGSADTFFQRVNMRFNGERVLERELVSIDRADLDDAYYHYIDHMRRIDNPHGVPLTKEEFRTMYNIYCFDLQHQDKTLFDTNRSHEIAYDITSSHGGTPATADYYIYSVVILQAKAKIVGSNGQIYLVK